MAEGILNRLLTETWPGRAAKSALEALMLPGNVYQGNISMTGPDGRTNPEVIGQSADLAGLMMGGSYGAAPAGVLGSGMVRPRSFWRGTNPGDTRRISTGKDSWDNHLFMADNKDAASLYGSKLTQYEAAPDAKILYEGTAEYRKVAGAWRKNENMLEYSNRAAEAAKAAGYDAVWFKRQGDVGTAVFNPQKFKAIDPEK
jgi:hypothetical protein